MVRKHAGTSVEENIQKVSRLFIELFGKVIGYCSCAAKPFINGLVNLCLCPFSLLKFFFSLVIGNLSRKSGCMSYAGTTCCLNCCVKSHDISKETRDQVGREYV